MENFCLVLGESNILPGNLWTEYIVDVLEDRIICTAKKDSSICIVIEYQSFKKAEFGIGNGNLWLQCELDDHKILTFCSPKKCWKSEIGKKLIDHINSVTPIIDMKEYQKYTGKFGFLYMFK